MSAKNCMLCGKPLGRIRVGAGGDFCSREHRNQYRLRKGMDCLTEANKVSALARRRENPKALFADAAPGIAKAAPRGFLDAPSVMLSAAGRPAAPVRGTSWNSGGHLPEAGMAPLRRVSAGSCGEPRAFGMKLSTAGRLAGAGRPAKPAVVYQTTLGGRDGKLQRVAPAASMGNAFRVSARVAFRQPQSGAAGRAFTGAGRSGPVAANGLPAAPRTVRLLVPARIPGTGRDGSRMAYGEMGFTGSPDAPAPVEWVGLVLRKGLGREFQKS